MDERWRTNHDVVWNQSAPSQSTHAPQASTHYRPSHPHADGQPAVAPYSTPPYAASQPAQNPFAEIQFLRQQLAQCQQQHAAEHAQLRSENHSLRLATQQPAAQPHPDPELIAENRSLKQRVEASAEASRQSKLQASKLKQELEHLAAAAVAEQQQASKRYASLVQRHETASTELDRSIKSLETQVGQLIHVNATWQRAQAVSLEACDFYDDQSRLVDAQWNAVLERYEEKLERYEEKLERREGKLGRYEREIESLQQWVHVLKTDHELVELICDDLDHENAKSLALASDLQTDIDQLLAQRALLQQQLGETDALLFAKDQAILATKSVADESYAELAQVNEDQVELVRRHEEQEVQIGELSESLETAWNDLETVQQQLKVAVDERTRNEHTLRELESGARAAQASAQLEASELENQFAIEIERMESQIESQALKTEASQRENDQLQERLDHALEQHRHSVSALGTEADKRQEMERSLESLTLQHETSAGELQMLNRELQENRKQLATYANQVATLQCKLEKRDQAIEQTAQPSVASSPRIHEVDRQQADIAERAPDATEALVGEVKRLSQELAQRISLHASERDQFRRRVEQLGRSATSAAGTRAA